ncbi:hypothetical protein PIB30_058408 [Stylosanthes scabra]|uniref:Transposase MuDR plant domain-containing protein n=1 Tax=Stylosanthes scabra TaxID=79078 RepID=A0ABU6SLA0_9FABA|nr:hypothetical protein [Stylosanthes scabra]
MRTATPGANASDPAPEVDASMTADPIEVVPPSKHTKESESGDEDPGDTEGGSFGSGGDEIVSTTPVDAMEEEQLTDIRDGGNDYDLDGGVELQVGHMFCSREAVHMGVNNYSIGRAAEYKLLESDSVKYHCVCKQSTNGCLWRVRVAYRINL